MADAKQIRLTSNYTELKKLIDNANYPKAIKACNKIIHEFDHEEKAWVCKVVALINLGQFKDAIDVVNKSKFASSLVFEKAYCEYRLNEVHDAWVTISTDVQPTPRIKELQAQILYRLERYDDCYSIYRDIIRTTSDDFDLERQTNMSSVSVNQRIEGTSESANVSIDASSYELVYNGATELLAAGRIEEALTQLQAAESQCCKYLAQEEAASEDEINEESAIIRVQQGHCLQLLGKEREALSMYNSVLKSKPEDPALLAIINNNLVSLNRTANVFDSRKRMKTATAAGLEHKLTSRQRGAITLNHSLLAYHTHQSDLCSSEADKLLEQFPQLSTSGALVKAAQLGRLGQLDEVVSTLQRCATNNPNDKTLLTLATVQILLSQGAVDQATGVLSCMEDKEKFRAGIVSALVTLNTTLNKKDAASTILRLAVEWHKENKTSSRQLSDLWRHAADFHLRCGDAPTAAASLLQLHKLNPSDVNTLAQLISAYAQYDTPSAKSLAVKLPPVSKLIASLDTDSLESYVGSRYFRKVAAGRVGESSPASPMSPKDGLVGNEELKKSKKKKKRKTRLPKDYIKGVDPDPERWLPRWQRKGYRKKKDRRGKDIGRGTQGVSSEQADKFDITKTATAQNRSSKSANTTPQTKSGPRSNASKKKGGKKKKGAW